MSNYVSPAGFLQSLLNSVASGLASLNQIAGGLKDRNHPGMACESLYQRFDIRSTQLSSCCSLRLRASVRTLLQYSIATDNSAANRKIRNVRCRRHQTTARVRP